MGNTGRSGTGQGQCLEKQSKCPATHCPLRPVSAANCPWYEGKDAHLVLAKAHWWRSISALYFMFSRSISMHGTTTPNLLVQQCARAHDR